MSYSPVRFNRTPRYGLIVLPGTKSLSPPLSERDVKKLRIGELVKINGQIVTARDRAYIRVLKFFRAGKRLPLDLRGAVIYHCGPIARKTPRSWQILSAGPTTSARLDRMQAEFAKRTGVRVLIGKGGVGEEVAVELARLGCAYLAFTGGAGVLAAQAIEKVERVLWQDLGTAEALWVLRVRDFGPLVVAIDTKGNNLYLHQKHQKKIKKARKGVFPLALPGARDRSKMDNLRLLENELSVVLNPKRL